MWGLEKQIYFIVASKLFNLIKPPKAVIEFSDFRPIGDGGHQTNQTSKIKALVNTRHGIAAAAVDVPVDAAIAQVDEVVTASTADGRRPGVVQPPACGSKRSCACVIQA